MKISIIIPTYNVEPYICRCLESVFEQTYRHLEVIVVDDCSSDRTMGKVQDFIGGHFCKDIVFKYLMHDCNRGAGAARNTGIMDATGDFLFFLDGDDWLIPECIELLLSYVDKYPDVEMVCAGLKVTEGPQWLSYEKKDLPEYLSDRNETNKILLQKDCLNPTACNKFIKRSLVIENNIFFEENYLFEDDIWNFEVAKHVSKIAICKHDTYVYVKREGSTMSAAVSKLAPYRLRELQYFVNNISGQYQERQISFVYHFFQVHFLRDTHKTRSKDVWCAYDRLIEKSKGRQKLALWIIGKVDIRVLRKFHLLGIIGKVIKDV